MSSTRTPGIRIDNRTNCLIIDKEHRGTFADRAGRYLSAFKGKRAAEH